jgi:uncharacterized RDD family membrane protein YckC
MDAQGPLQFSHSGTRYLLGYGRDFFGIWDRQAPETPTERFPRTDDGWRDAWLRYTALEPTWVEVGLQGPAGPPASPPPGWARPPEVALPTLASPWRRLAARFVDGLILAGIITALVATGVVHFDFSSVDAIPRAFFVMAIVVGGIYETGFIAVRGQTPGKMVLGIRVVRVESGSLPGLGRAVARWVVPAVASLIPLGALVVYGWLLWDRRRQGLHDKAAGTVVVSST